MRVVRICFGILMASGFVAAGCGGDGKPNSPAPGSGGKGGSAGTNTTGGTAGSGGTTGGTAGTGGSAGTAGSAGNVSGGGAGTGGSAGTAGSSGTAGSAGTNAGGQGGEGGASGEACPSTAPEDGDECNNDVNPGGGDDPCTYTAAGVETTCACTGFADPTWDCQALTCPTAAPTDGETCDADMNPGGGDDPCVYDMLECTCAGGGFGGGMAEWECAAPPMCPGTAPMDGDTCDTDTDPGAMDGGCAFGMTTCVCQGGGGGGMQRWNCGTCPATEPEDESDCDNTVNAFCSYGDTTCTCGFMDEWNCD
jgi:hypothetical protein